MQPNRITHFISWLILLISCSICIISLELFDTNTTQSSLHSVKFQHLQRFEMRLSEKDIPVYTESFPPGNQKSITSSATAKLRQWFEISKPKCIETVLVPCLINQSTDQLTCHSQPSGLPIGLIHPPSEFQSVSRREVEFNWVWLNQIQ